MEWIKRNWLYILAFTLPFERIPSFDLPLGSSSITIKINFIIALLVMAAAALQVAKQRRLNLTRPDKWLVAYVAVMVLSLAVADNRLRALQVIVATVLMIVLALVIERTFQRFDLVKIYRVLLTSAIVMGAIGMYQFVADTAGVPTAFTGLKDIYTKMVFGFPRIQATALEPLYLASFLLLPMSLLVARMYTRVVTWKHCAVLAFLVMIVALTLSRGGIYAGLGAATAIFVALRAHGSWRRAGVVVGSIVCGALAAVALVYITTNLSQAPQNSVSRYLNQTTKLSSSSGSADSDRVINRNLAIRAFRENPVLGVGIGNFGRYAQTHDPSYKNNPSVIVNNEYLEILAETGIVGFSTLAGLALVVLLQIRTAWRRAKPEQQVWIAAFSAYLVAAGIQFYSFSTLYIVQIWFAIGILLALTGPFRNTSHEYAK